MHFDAFLGENDIILINPALSFQSADRVFRFTNEVKKDVSLDVFCSMSVICIVGTVVMIIPHSNHLSFLLQKLSVIYNIFGQ